MAEKKKKLFPGRRAYLEDFHPTVSGEYIYTGQTYDFQGGPEARKKSLTRLAALGILTAAAAVAGSCVSGPGTISCIYVLLPSAAALLAALTTLWAALRLVTSVSPLRQYVYQATVKQLPLRSTLTAVCSALAIVGECVYAALHGLGGQGGGMALFLLCEAAALACALLFRRLNAAMVWLPRQKQEEAPASSDAGPL